MQGGVDAMFSNITLRGLLAPGGHVAWTALVGAALWKVRGNQPLSMAHLTDIRFLRVFLMSVALHMIWNSNLPSPFFIRHIILVGLAWLVILLFVQDGLKQVRDEQKALGITPPGQERTAPATA
uniref:Uncharacterized protein n=1 Tax=uncultured Armatimonadetes bacterium TaxID=157466 RepID=A0A6J4KAM6_9BACT|nr:hypothetical protein AVDCRST_MAG63-5055 [uncultured Armatimonadetes bacterium]